MSEQQQPEPDRNPDADADADTSKLSVMLFKGNDLPAEHRERLDTLSRLTSIPFTDDATFPDVCLSLELVEDQLRLVATVNRGDELLTKAKPIAIDWSIINTTANAGARLTQPIAKAVGIKKGNSYRPHVIDATAGLGEDSYLMNQLGCRVTLIERCPTVAAMLMVAASQIDASRAEPMRVIHTNAIDWLTALGQCNETKTETIDRPDVVYLDPMFPQGRKTVERKAMRLLRWLAGDDNDADELLAKALATATQRVVVKRPRKAKPLGDETRLPNLAFKGQAVRYDVYLVQKK